MGKKGVITALFGYDVVTLIVVSILIIGGIYIVGKILGLIKFI